MLPLGLAIAAALTLMVLIAAPGGAAARPVLADVSLMFLIIPAVLGGAVLLAVIGALIWGLVYALRELPYLFKQAQDFVALVAYQTKVGAAQIANVILSTQAFVAGVQKTTDNIRSIFALGRSG